MKTVRRLVVAGCVAAISLMNAAARAQVVKQIPSDALIVIKVNNLQQTSNKIAGLAKQFGISDMLPMMGDPLAALEDKVTMSKGLNKEGEFAFAYLNDDAYKPAEAKAGDNKPARTRPRLVSFVTTGVRQGAHGRAQSHEPSETNDLATYGLTLSYY